MGGARWALLLAGLLPVASTVTAQPADVPLRRGPDLRRGLTSGAVTALHRDRAGFLWIGTRAGLLRFDGYRFDVYKHDVANPDSIAGNSVRVIFEDSRGRLWIGLNSAGLDRFDRAARRFVHHRHVSGDETTISNDSVTVIAEDHRGTLWVGTQIGLNRFEETSATFRRILSDDQGPSGRGANYIYALCEDRQNRLWVGTVGGGLARVDGEGRVLERFAAGSALPSGLGAASVFALLEDRNGIIWIGTEDGLRRLDPRAQGLSRVPLTQGAGRSGGGLVTSLTEDGEGRIWIGTWDRGLARIDTTMPESQLRIVASAPVGEAPDRIVALHADDEGNLWIGTWESGLRRLAWADRGFVLLGEKAADSPLRLDATALAVGARGELYVGTWGHGLKRLDCDPEGKCVVRTLLGEGTVLSLLIDRQDRIWTGTMDGLHRLAPEGGRSERFGGDRSRPGSLGPGYVTALLEDRSGRLWVGVGGSGLYRLDGDGKTFRRYSHAPDDPTSLSDDYITALLEDGTGRIWVGTRSGGLNVMDPQSGRCERFVPDPLDPTSLSHHYVTSLQRDPRGGVWVGTDGGGVDHVDWSGDDRPRITHLAGAEGLVDTDVVSLVPDDDGGLWIGSRAGLSRLAPDRSRIASYGEADGLPSSQFNLSSVAQGKHRLYFGSSSGIVGVDRGRPFEEPHPSPVRLTAVHLLGTAPERDLSPERPVEIDYGQVISFEFSVLDFDPARRHRYAYRMGGERSEWIELGARRELTFTRLDPGRYVLEVKGRNQKGVWSEPSPPLAIHVVPPLWMTWWFRGAMLLALFGLGFAAHRYRTARLKQRNKELLVLKEQRESALEEVRRREGELQDAYRRLRQLTRRLEAAREDERKKIARELHDELGQVLTAAKINLQLLLSRDRAWEEREERLRDAVGLLDKMIQHTRRLSLSLRPPLLEELGLMPALKGYLEGQARRAGVTISFEPPRSELPLSPELEITIFRTVQEAVTNTIRHAGARKVNVSACVEEEELVVAIGDDGRGFDVSSALERGQRGEHLGLLGIQERAAALGGEVEIDSSEGRGTRLRVRLPLAGREEEQHARRARG